MHIYICICIYIYMYMYIYVYTIYILYIYIYIYIYIYMYIYVYVYVYVYTYLDGSVWCISDLQIGECDARLNRLHHSAGIEKSPRWKSYVAEFVRHCNNLQHTATPLSSTCRVPNQTSSLHPRQRHCNTMQHTATRCNTLQHAATRHYHLLAVPNQTSSLHPRQRQPPRKIPIQPVGAAGSAVVIHMVRLANDEGEDTIVINRLAALGLLLRVEVNVENQRSKTADQHWRQSVPNHIGVSKIVAGSQTPQHRGQGVQFLKQKHFRFQK